MSGGGEAHCAEWSYSSMLREFREATMPRGGPCAAERRPRAAERRPLCRRQESPVPRGGPLCR